MPKMVIVLLEKCTKEKSDLAEKKWVVFYENSGEYLYNIYLKNNNLYINLYFVCIKLYIIIYILTSLITLSSVSTWALLLRDRDVYFLVSFDA